MSGESASLVPVLDQSLWAEQSLDHQVGGPTRRPLLARLFCQGKAVHQAVAARKRQRIRAASPGVMG
jgi:hypothetical protein